MPGNFGGLVLPSSSKRKKISSLAAKMSHMRHLPIEGQEGSTQRVMKYESLTERIKRFSRGWEKVNNG